MCKDSVRGRKIAEVLTEEYIMLVCSVSRCAKEFFWSFRSASASGPSRRKEVDEAFRCLATSRFAFLARTESARVSKIAGRFDVLPRPMSPFAVRVATECSPSTALDVNWRRDKAINVIIRECNYNNNPCSSITNSEQVDFGGRSRREDLYWHSGDRAVWGRLNRC